MPQMERPDERRARDAVARGTGLDFIFTDLNGSVDYKTSSDSAALEVTRFTDPLVRRDLDGASNVTTSSPWARASTGGCRSRAIRSTTAWPHGYTLRSSLLRPMAFATMTMRR